MDPEETDTWLTKWHRKTKIMVELLHDRAVVRSENPGGLVVMGGDNVPTLVEICDGPAMKIKKIRKKT